MARKAGQLRVQHNYLHKINTAGTKMFAYRTATDITPIAIFEKRGQYWIYDNRQFMTVSSALDGIDDPEIGKPFKKKKEKDNDTRPKS